MDVIEPVTLNALAQLVWPMCRISAFLASMFTLSSRSIPTLCKALIAISISVCILPSIPDLKQDANPFSLYGFMVTIKEVLIGLALGYATLFISQCFILAGQTIAMQTGLGFASLVDPVSGTNTPVVGQFFTVLCTLVFFSVNGHLIFFRLIMESFTSLPMGNFIPRMSLYDLLFFTAIMFNAGLTMAWIYEQMEAPRPIPLMEIHGTEDRVSEWMGDMENKGGWGAYLPVPLAIGYWIAKNRCSHEQVENMQGNEGHLIIKHRYSSPTTGCDVWLYEVVGGVHSWFTNDIDTGEEVWQFFSRYVK